MSVAIPSLRAAIAVPPWVKNDLWRRARAVPSLDLRFADNKSLIDAVTGASLVTFTRASSKTVTNSARVLETVGIDVPAFDHNPITGESLGLLVEEQRTNSIRNNTGVGAVAGTPGTLPTNWATSGFGGLSREIIGVGSVNGVSYIDIKYTGTATQTFGNLFLEVTTSTASADGVSWTNSAWLQVVNGSLSGISAISLNLGQFTSVPSGLADAPGGTQSSPITSSFQRITRTHTTNNALVAFVRSYINFTIVNGAAIDIALRIGLPQLEQGATVSSVIPTTTAAVTRSASLADLISSAIANNIRTLYLEFRSPASGTRGVASLNDNTANERASVLTSGTDPRLVVVDGGVEQANVNGGTVTANQRTRVAVRINANDFAISINGGAVVTDTSGTLPTVDRLMLGRTQAGEYLNGTLARVTGWTQLLPDSTLQSLAQ
jgi:hypothetical protein